MANHEQAVRDAALTLKKAINDASAAGYRISWPGNAAGLDTIAISETAAVKPPPEPDPKPAPASTRQAAIAASKAAGDPSAL